MSATAKPGPGWSQEPQDAIQVSHADGRVLSSWAVTCCTVPPRVHVSRMLDLKLSEALSPGCEHLKENLTCCTKCLPLLSQCFQRNAWRSPGLEILLFLNSPNSLPSFFFFQFYACILYFVRSLSAMNNTATFSCGLCCWPYYRLEAMFLKTHGNCLFALQPCIFLASNSSEFVKTE